MARAHRSSSRNCIFCTWDISTIIRYGTFCCASSWAYKHIYQTSHFNFDTSGEYPHSWDFWNYSQCVIFLVCIIGSYWIYHHRFRSCTHWINCCLTYYVDYRFIHINLKILVMQKIPMGIFCCML